MVITDHFPIVRIEIFSGEIIVVPQARDSGLPFAAFYFWGEYRAARGEP